MACDGIGILVHVSKLAESSNISSGGDILCTGSMVNGDFVDDNVRLVVVVSDSNADDGIITSNVGNGDVVADTFVFASLSLMIKIVFVKLN